jgi:hypothetical protein
LLLYDTKAHIDNEVYLSKALERLGANAMTKDQEPDIGAAFIKFSIVTKELSALMKTLVCILLFSFSHSFVKSSLSHSSSY